MLEYRQQASYNLMGDDEDFTLNSLSPDVVREGQREDHSLKY